MPEPKTPVFGDPVWSGVECDNCDRPISVYRIVGRLTLVACSIGCWRELTKNMEHRDV